MNATPSALLGVCPACRWQSLFRRFQKQPHLHLVETCRRFASTEKSTRPRRRNKAQQQESAPVQPQPSSVQQINKPPPRPPTPVQWQSLSKQGRLGKQGSVVLVVRDAEGKRKASLLGKEEKQDVQPATTQNILSMLKSTTAAHEEVLQSIATLKPPMLQHSHDGTPTIPRAKFEETLEALCEGYNSKQLARYYHSSRHAKRKELTKSSRTLQASDAPKNQPVTTSRWMVVTPSEYDIPTDRYKGKRGLANKIIRYTWGFEVAEEIESKGTTILNINPVHMPVVVSGDNAYTLRELSREQDVTIDVARSTGTITLSGKKYQCLEVAARIEKMLQDISMIELNFRAFQSLTDEHIKAPDKSVKSTLGKLDDIAKMYSCTLARNKAGNKLLIRAGNRVDAERCQRAITASFTQFIRRNEKVLSTYLQFRDKGTLCATPTGSKTLPFSYRNRRLGRLSTTLIVISTNIKPDDPDHLKINGPGRTLFQEDTEVLNYLLKTPRTFNLSIEARTKTSHSSKGLASGQDLSEQWAPSSTTQIFAELGHVLHDMEGPNTVQSVLNSKLIKNNPYPGFVPTLNGLPQFMQANLSKAQRSNKHRLRILLMPSPWSFDFFAEQKRFPPLEMTLTFTEFSYGTLTVESLVAITDHHIMNVLMPNLAHDIRFHRKDFAVCERPAEIPKIAGFVKEIAGTMQGYGTIRAPLTLDLDIPNWLVRTLRKPASASTSTNVEDAKDSHHVQYFTLGVEYDESQIYPFRNHDMVIRQVGGGEFGVSSETIQLHCPSISSAAIHNESPKAAAANELKVKTFVDASAKLLKEMNIAVGNMRMMFTNPRVADHRVTQKQRVKLLEAESAPKTIKVAGKLSATK